MPGEWGTIHVDDEGMPSQRNVLIENGVLKSYLVDLIGSRQMNHPRTGSARRQGYTFAPTSRMTNTFFAVSYTHLAGNAVMPEACFDPFKLAVCAGKHREFGERTRVLPGSGRRTGGQHVQPARHAGDFLCDPNAFGKRRVRTQKTHCGSARPHRDQIPRTAGVVRNDALRSRKNLRRRAVVCTETDGVKLRKISA